MIRNLHKATDNTATDTTSSSGSGFLSSFGEGPYAFKTLWQEITKGIQAVVNGITSISNTRNTNAAQTEWIFWSTAKDRQTKMNNNIGFYIIIGLVIVAATTIIITKQKK